MVIKNGRAKKQISAVYTFVFLVFVIGVIDDMITGHYHNFLGEYFFISIFSVSLLILYWLGLPFFEYDSDGEALVVKASEPVLISNVTGKRFSAEFPKSKLVDFEIEKSFLKKTLYLHLNSKDKKTVLKTSVSYLNKNELSTLEKSLNNVLKNNDKSILVN